MAWEFTEITTIGAGDWTVPSGVTCVDIECWGGGAGGGLGQGGGGGGGGGYARTNSYPVTAGATISYSVAPTSIPDDKGSATWFGNGPTPSVQASGGGAAAVNIGGIGSDNGGMLGDYLKAGGTGGDGWVNINGAGGGGGGCGASAFAGNNGTNAATTVPGVGGTGGGTNGGNGGDGGDTSPQSGYPGGSYGGGGGGDAEFLGGSSGAGDGAQGIIRLTYFQTLTAAILFRSPTGGVAMGGAFTY